jgi:hypothetical protein
MSLSGDLDRFIHGEVFVPSILVISTERVAQSVESRFGMSITDLFTPFGGYYTPISVQYRVLDKPTPYRQQGFKVRFSDSVARRDESSIPLIGNRDILFEKWFSNFTRSLQWSNFECLNQPIATILIVSSEDDNIIDSFEQLSHIANQPELCRSGILDPTSVRVKLLLDNNESGSVSREFIDKIMAQLRTIYTQNSVMLLPLTGTAIGDTDDMHAAIFPSTLAERTRSIGWKDVETLNQVVEQVVSGNALPWLERKLAQLDANITAKRKGLRNQLKNLLRPDPQLLGNHLGLQQVEWQCRLAGDIAFHLHAYDVAFGFYRNVCGDLKQEKSTQLAAAGCYEMSGLSGFLSGQTNWTDIARFFDVAIELYIGGGKHDNAIRAAVLQAMALKGRPEAADKLVKVNGIVGGGSLRSAILLDQAARLHGSVKARRKEAFTQVLAGHMFNKVEGGRELALDCYSSVLNVYGQDWTCIRDHLLFTMGKLEYGMGHFESAFKLIKQLLSNTTNGTVEKHSNYVKLLTYVAKSIGAPVVEDINFPLPLVQVAKFEEDYVRLELKNPLLVPIDMERLTVRFEEGDCEESGSIQLGPLETRSVELMTSACGNTLRIEWLLLGLIRTGKY